MGERNERELKDDIERCELEFAKQCERDESYMAVSAAYAMNDAYRAYIKYLEDRDVVRCTHIANLNHRIRELEEYKFMYEGLCK